MQSHMHVCLTSIPNTHTFKEMLFRQYIMLILNILELFSIIDPLLRHGARDNFTNLWADMVRIHALFMGCRGR